MIRRLLLLLCLAGFAGCQPVASVTPVAVQAPASAAQLERTRLQSILQAHGLSTLQLTGLGYSQAEQVLQAHQLDMKTLFRAVHPEVTDPGFRITWLWPWQNVWCSPWWSRACMADWWAWVSAGCSGPCS